MPRKNKGEKSPGEEDEVSSEHKLVTHENSKIFDDKSRKLDNRLFISVKRRNKEINKPEAASSKSVDEDRIVDIKKEDPETMVQDIEIPESIVEQSEEKPSDKKYSTKESQTDTIECEDSDDSDDCEDSEEEMYHSKPADLDKKPTQPPTNGCTKQTSLTCTQCNARIPISCNSLEELTIKHCSSENKGPPKSQPPTDLQVSSKPQSSSSPETSKNSECPTTRYIICVPPQHEVANCTRYTNPPAVNSKTKLAVSCSTSSEHDANKDQNQLTRNTSNKQEGIEESNTSTSCTCKARHVKYQQ